MAVVFQGNSNLQPGSAASIPGDQSLQFSQSNQGADKFSPCNNDDGRLSRLESLVTKIVEKDGNGTLTHSDVDTPGARGSGDL
eukprot:4775916-Karenia_brevis.AAC.1